MHTYNNISCYFTLSTDCGLAMITFAALWFGGEERVDYSTTQNIPNTLIFTKMIHLTPSWDISTKEKFAATAKFLFCEQFDVAIWNCFKIIQ